MKNRKTNLYPQNPCARFGQSRFGPVKRTALDGKVWWRIYDYSLLSEQGKFRTRRAALIQIAVNLRNGSLDYKPDPGFGKKWLLGLSAEEVRHLLNKPAKPSKGDS